MQKSLFQDLPDWVNRVLRGIYNFARSVYYSGNGRFCPVCGKTSRKFAAYGINPRADARCVHCGSLERHRFLWLFFTKKTNLFDRTPKKMLHVAPEQCFEPRFKELIGEGYITADLLDNHAMVKMDITDIQYPADYFDVIYCSHVLEHVPDDKKAMREFHRVLKPDGWAILLVPVDVEKTIEDPFMVDPTERLKLFGQEDHVRVYGRDYVDRLRQAGFMVDVTKVSDLFGEEDIELMGLTRSSGEIYFCKK